MTVHQFPNVPIVGQRSWKSFDVQIRQLDPADVWVPTGKLVAQQFPRGLFIIQVSGVRSDDLPCQMVGQLPGNGFAEPARLGMFIATLTAHLQTYRDCACAPNDMCALHRGGVPNAEVGPGSDAGAPGAPVRH